jgi:hypothetical protein
MFGFLKKLFGSKTEEAQVSQAPYKVEVPTPIAEKATEAVVTSIVPAKEEKSAPAKITAAPKKQGGNKKQGAAKKQGGNKPRKPRAPKVPKA